MQSDESTPLASDQPVGETQRRRSAKPAELYKQVTPLRRQGVASAFITAHVIAMFAIGYVPILFPVGIITTLGVVLVCVMVLTGPIYMPRLDYKRGVLDTWGIGNKIAAVVILLLFISGYGLLVYWLFFRAAN